MGLFAIIGWHIWLARNAWVFKREWKVETRIMEEALDEFNLFLQATKTNQSCSQRAILESRPLWVPPDPGVLKINVDGVFAARTRKGGVGVVLHDFEGKILGATAVPMHERMSAEMVEAEGFRIAMDCSICSHGSSYVVEGDAQSVVNMLQGKSQIKASLKVIVRKHFIFLLVIIILFCFSLFLTKVIRWLML